MVSVKTGIVFRAPVDHFGLELVCDLVHHVDLNHSVLDSPEFDDISRVKLESPLALAIMALQRPNDQVNIVRVAVFLGHLIRSRLLLLRDVYVVNF